MVGRIAQGSGRASNGGHSENMNQLETIESLYTRHRQAGGQEAQRALNVDATSVAQSFAHTVSQLEEALRGSGRFHEGGRTPLRGIAEREHDREVEPFPSTHDLAAFLWKPATWSVAGRSELDFIYVDREIVPGRIVEDGKAAYGAPKVSADLLLANANAGDGTPIVAEVKLRGDENVELALIQALASAAQLSLPAQRQRLQAHYSDYFGGEVPDRLDVYVISYKPPEKGTKPKLYESARHLTQALTTGGQLDQWVRRIVLLEARFEDGALTFFERAK